MNTPSSNGTHHSPTRPPVGVLEWFRPGEHERVERAADALAHLGIRHLRTGVSWADFHTPEGAEWYAWLLPALAARFDVLPCFSYTPPSIGERPQTSAPPKNLDDYAAFVALMCDRHGESFEWAELWNEPNNQREWDATLDAGHEKFARMVRAAAGGARAKGKKVLLGGLSPIDPNFFSMLHERGALACFDAVGVHGFPHSFEFHWPGWADLITGVRQRLAYCGSGAEVWITEAGYSTWRHDEWEQLATFADAVNAPAARLYWYALYDLHPALPTVDGFHSDEREYSFGLLRTDGGEKLLARVWRDRGIEGVMQFARLTEPDVRRRGGIYSGVGVPPARQKEKIEKPVLITGGAGFVGTNLADRLARDGRRVHLFDNLSRPGVEDNLRRLKSAHGDRVHFECADVRNEHALRGAVANASAVYHFAAQVAVTTSLTSPAHDFEVNARGTLNLLEALRPMGKKRAAAAVHQHQQGLRRFGRPAPAPAPRPVRAARRCLPRQRRRRESAARLPQPLRLLQGGGRPVRAGLRPHLQFARVRLPHVVHLRPPPMRQRGPGVGRPLRPPSIGRRAGDALRRRAAGARRALRRRP